jgi:peptide/nickel transport system permease protein
VASTLSFMGISMPVFWLGLILQLVFAVELRWFPSAGRLGPMGGDLVNRLQHLVLPMCTLAVLYASSWMRYVRASLIETLGSVFIRAGRARGASDSRVLFRHALPNALIPLTTVWGMDLALLFSGAVVTETVFAWPGMGSLLVESVYRRDYSVLMGILMCGSVLIVLINLATDVVYGWLDPRVRLVEGDGGAREK